MRGRLEKGNTEQVIADILAAAAVASVRSLLVKACLNHEAVVEIISRYMKQVVVRRIRLADFMPSVRTVEKERIAGVAGEFQNFLETELAEAEDEAEVLPILQIE